MALDANNQLLVDTLEAAPLVDGRYENVKLVNYNSLNDVRRGCLSMVFGAFDTISQKKVALKFYDLSPALMHDQYRRAAFFREHELLERLITVDRCLQLVSLMSTFNLTVKHGSATLTLPCHYFAVEWIDNEVDAFFLSANKFSAVDKLRLFNEIVLSVETLHNHDIFHRDLKADNLRSYTEALKRTVVAIDLGTAARLDSGKIQIGYGSHVGARGYAAPEAIGGLTDNRRVAKYTDMYALGCLLFELFNMDYYFVAVRRKNHAFDTVIAAIASKITGTTDIEREQDWCTAMTPLAGGFTPVSIAEPGSSVPPGVVAILDEILSSLTNFDYRRRAHTLASVRQRVWSALRVLTNEQEYQRKLTQARKLKQLRREKVAAREAKISSRRVA
jgi:serine/threonine protein kinase